MPCPQFRPLVISDLQVERMFMKRALRNTIFSLTKFEQAHYSRVRWRESVYSTSHSIKSVQSNCQAPRQSFRVPECFDRYNFDYILGIQSRNQKHSCEIEKWGPNTASINRIDSLLTVGPRFRTHAFDFLDTA